MSQKKAIVIDVPIRKFLEVQEDGPMAKASGQLSAISSQPSAVGCQARESEALVRENSHPVSPNPGETRVGQPLANENLVIGRSGDRAIEKAGVCLRRRANGSICGRPADGGNDECWLHAEWYSLLPAVFGMPYPEDAVAIHQILARTMSMVIGGEMSPQKAQAVTKLCRELRRNLMWYQREMGMW